MKRLVTFLVLAALLAAVPRPALAGRRIPSGLTIDWSAIVRALRITLQAWRFSPLPTPTAPPATATEVPPTAIETQTPVPTATPSLTPVATHTRTAIPTATLPPATFTPTVTSPPATFTVTPEPRGQLGLGVSTGIPPAQKLASAMIAFPYVVYEGDTDTRIELVNLSSEDQTVQCFYVRQSDCGEIGFFITLTARQPLSWLVGEGTNNPLTFTAVPPFDGVGELKCAVAPRRPDLSAHNVLQGRALVFDTNGETVGYGAIGFQRLVPGEFGGVANLDGGTYEACPERLHFQVLTRQSGAPSSSLVLVPCDEDLLTQTATTTVVQLAIVNEFEQVFSRSFSFTCHTQKSFSAISTLSKTVLGSDTAHLVVRGVASPVIGLVVERFSGFGQTHTTANEPFLEGGRAGTIVFP